MVSPRKIKTKTIMNFYKQSRFQAPTLGSDFIKYCHNFPKQKTQAMFEITFSLHDWFCVCHLLLSSSKHHNIHLWPLSQPQRTGKVTLSAGGPVPSQKSKRVLSCESILKSLLTLLHFCFCFMFWVFCWFFFFASRHVESYKVMSYPLEHQGGPPQVNF